MARVVLSKVWKKYGNADVVKDVSLDIPDKEFFVLVGPSGCGKSTTLRMIAGLEELSQGDISINGRLVNDVPPKHRDVAMVFQNYSLYPHMTVYENMAFGLKLRNYPKSEIERRVNEAARDLKIEKLLDRKPKALSGGQRQRVAVGRAIVRKPQVFLFDEPLSNLDAKLRAEMRVELSKLHHNLKTTMIYVTHDQVEAMTMGDRICVMHEGVVQQVAAPLDLYQKPANKFVAGFIGNPPMNFFPVQVESEKNSFWFRHKSFRLIAPKSIGDRLKPYLGKEVALGIRPEDLYDRLFYNYKVLEGSTLKAKVDVVEPVGAEIYLYMKTGSADLIVRVPSYVKTQVGQDMELVFNLERLQVFDKDSGKSAL